jgi:hypothetical protein
MQRPRANAAHPAEHTCLLISIINVAVWVAQPDLRLLRSVGMRKSVKDLPRLYRLDRIPIVGHLGYVQPPGINCPQCGRQNRSFDQLELILDAVPRCDLVASASGEYFATPRLVGELEHLGARGYSSHAISVGISDDFQLSSPGLGEMWTPAAQLEYVVITGKCDGPWTRNAQGSACAICGQPIPIPLRDDSLDPLLTDGAEQPTLVYADTWHGEDFFTVSEPGLPVITERVVTVLRATGNLREELVEDPERLQRVMPKYAQELEKRGWRLAACAVLGPAAWA